LLVWKVAPSIIEDRPSFNLAQLPPRIAATVLNDRDHAE
jgi:hypothetical protein